MIGGSNPDWAFIGTGAGLIAVAVPLGINAKRRTKQAAMLHNDALNRPTSSLHFSPMGNGISLQLQF
jgi:hypothetical protein